MAANLCILAGIPYTRNMTNAASNISALRPATVPAPTRAARAAFVHEALKGERWSIRQAALALGMNVSVLSTRVNGSTAFLADEIEAIAVLLKEEPVDFYGRYISAGPATVEPESNPLPMD